MAHCIPSAGFVRAGRERMPLPPSGGADEYQGGTEIRVIEQSLPQGFGFGEGLEVVHIHYHQSGGLRQAVAPSAGEYAAGVT